jgi:Ni/Co efflux regulator RcnB
MKILITRSIAIAVLLSTAQGSSFSQGRPDAPGHCGPGDRGCGAQPNGQRRVIPNGLAHGGDRIVNGGQDQGDQGDQRQQWRGERRSGEYGAGPERSYYRGERLPPQYNQHQYVVDDWRGHGLHSPPRGYHWVQTGGDYVLAAIATGLIVDLLINR